MNESEANNSSPDAGAATMPATDTTARFERGADMRALYEQMRPDQRTAIAGEFIRVLSLAGDDHVEQFRQKFQQHTQITYHATDELLSADQVAAIDGYIRQSHPEMIAQVLQHPVTQSALHMPGVATEEAPDVPVDKDKIAPAAESVAPTGTAYTTSWESAEQAGAEDEATHPYGAGPGGEIEREQRTMENEGEEAERPSEEQPGSNL